MGIVSVIDSRATDAKRAWRRCEMADSLFAAIGERAHRGNSPDAVVARLVTAAAARTSFSRMPGTPTFPYPAIGG